jgi:hypothetical protein
MEPVKKVWRKLPWKEIEPLLILAALAKTRAKRQQLMARVAEKYKVSQRTLEDKLGWMGYRYPNIDKGPAAIDEWERQTKLLAAVVQQRDRLELAVFKRAMDLRNRAHERECRAVGVKEAAKMLRIPRSLMKSMLFDLKLLQQDLNGKIPLPELRRFYWEDGRWLLKTYRYAKKERML